MSATSPPRRDSGVNGAIGVSLLAESRVATDSTLGSTGSIRAARLARSFTLDGSSSDRSCSYEPFGRSVYGRNREPRRTTKTLRAHGVLIADHGIARGLTASAARDDPARIVR
ncbi:hypothetical protein DBV15_01107 [Temnothorax longispinosus]|uniref:Uncharacterized protein n=1 Tax=Temnothorax longispinosus TaxID=300112 RepID=A0A4V3S657_9HYME|nr:hypothetical protein DBV15_01107 [Temnothorax longispinosus]